MAGIAGTSLMTLIAIRLIHLQIFQGAKFAKAAFYEHYRLVERHGRRGSIFDCQGRLLAVSLACDSLYADPKQIEDTVQLANTLSRILGDAPERYLERLSRKDRRFVWLYRNMTPTQSDALQQSTGKGIYFRKERFRYYPAGTETACIVGISSIDGDGLEGIEQSANSILTGKTGHELVSQDGLSRPYGAEDLILSESEDGKDITLTIDLGIQHYVSVELRKIMEEEHAQWGAVVVIDPRNGEIIAMVSEPHFDPNNYENTTPEMRRNRCLSQLVEPGSTFKAITFAAALSNGFLDPTETIDCLNGSIRIGNTKYSDWKPFGLLTAADVLVNSSNVGTIRIGQRVGGLKLANSAQRFGFGENIMPFFQSNQMGYIRTEAAARPASNASLSIGYGLAVTPIQLAAAYAIFAAQGMKVPPKIIHGQQTDIPVRVLEPEIAETMKTLLHQVIVRGTGKLAEPTYYTAAGKTGTARRYDPLEGRYDANRVTCVFAGFAPVDNPRIAVGIVIDDPQEHQWASKVTAPLFARIVDRTLRYLGVTPQEKVNP